MDQITYLPTDSLKPYKNNPRDNKNAVDAVAASIKEYGFRSPIIIDEQNTIINGHTRWKSAKQLGLTEVPCVKVTDLTEEQIREYRIIDNKTAEYATWDQDLLANELNDLDFGDLDFEFDFSNDLKKTKQWAETKKRCNLKDKVGTRKAIDCYYQSLFKSGNEGQLLQEIKTPENVWMFARTALEFVEGTLGPYLKGSGWGIMTTPRRRHKDFHFATKICEQLSNDLQIPFYPDAVVTDNTTRLDPRFRLATNPHERNILLYDDIITTGCTLKATRDLLIEQNYVVWPLISIDNH